MGFLTPTKITLLVLIDVYSEGIVPISQNVAFLSFITQSILPEPEDSHVQSDGIQSVADFEQSLTGQTSSVPGRSIWDLLLRRLWSLDCAAALDHFIDHFPLLLDKTREQLLRERDEGIPPEPAGKIQRTSPFGVFVRRCHLEYTKLQFQDSVAIWLDFVSYRLPTKQAFDRKNPHDARHALDANLQELQIDAAHPLAGIVFRPLVERMQGDRAFSSHDVEKLMEFQVSEMQRLGGRLPGSMRTQLNQMSKAGATVPKLGHYLKFLDTWRAGDYTSAFDNLHRYFDYTMQSRERTFYQYALLNLAILQADFGCHAEAIPAMQEAVATARENKDTTCLNYCMSWLYHFGRAFPAQMQKIRESGILGSEAEGLSFLKARAKDAEMWTLLSTSLLSEAKLALQHGDSIASVFESIVKAAHVTTTKNIPNAAGPAILMKSTVYNRLGQTHAAISCSERFLLSHSFDAPIEDVLKCTCRLASIQQCMGRADQAETTLASTPPDILRVLKFSNYHSTYTYMLKARRLLHHNDLATAEDILSTLRQQGPPDIETDFTLAFLEIDHLMRRSELSAALDKVEALSSRVELENNDITIKLKLMTLKARILANSNRPHKGFSIVMRATDMAYRARAMPMLYEAVLCLAHILNESYEFDGAHDLLRAILPGVLECLDCDLAGRTYSLLADTKMGLAGCEIDSTADKNGKKKWTKNKEGLVGAALEYIEKALEQWVFVEDLDGQLDCLSKKARIAMLRADRVLANDVAAVYMETQKRFVDGYLMD